LVPFILIIDTHKIIYIKFNKDQFDSNFLITLNYRKMFKKIGTKLTQRKKLSFISAFLGLAFLFSNSVIYGQSVERIAAIVNDDVVSMFDLRARIQLVIASSGIRPSRQTNQRLKQQILRALIDEKLQLQEAKKRNISISQRNIMKATAALEKQNDIKPGGFITFLKKRGLPRSAVFDRMRAQIAWSKLIRRRLVPRISIGDDEIDEILKRLKEQKGQSEFRISEILFSVNDDKQASEVQRTAQRLIEEIKAGANFKAVARQFSAAPTASTGGDLGWLHEKVLNTDLAGIVPKMKKGEIYGPFRTNSGFQVYRLVSKRKILETDPSEAIIDLQRITLPLYKNNSKKDHLQQMNLAKLISKNMSGCEEMVRMGKQAKARGKIILGKLSLKKLRNPLRDIIQNLEINKPSRPVKTPNGISIYMVCQKILPPTNFPTAKFIRNRLKQQRLSVLIRRYMRDLRSAAVINIRI